MKNIVHFLIFISSHAAFGASTQEIEVTVPDDSVLYSFEDKKEIQLKAGIPTAVAISTPQLLTSPNRMPMVLVPLYSEKSSLKLNPPLAAEVVEKAKQEDVSKLLVKILPEVQSIQEMVRSRQIDRALKDLDSLQARFPDIKFLNFLRASVIFLQGKRQEAAKLTEDTLKLYPDYSEGRKFLERINGAKAGN